MIVNENETAYDFSTRYENHKKFLHEYTRVKIWPSKNVPHFIKVIKEAFPSSSEFINLENELEIADGNGYIAENRMYTLLEVVKEDNQIEIQREKRKVEQSVVIERMMNARIKIP